MLQYIGFDTILIISLQNIKNICIFPLIVIEVDSAMLDSGQDVVLLHCHRSHILSIKIALKYIIFPFFIVSTETVFFFFFKFTQLLF